MTKLRLHHVRRRRLPTLAAEILEGRFAPTVNVLDSFTGIVNTDTSGGTPPDNGFSVGPTAVVASVNTAIAFYDKNTGALQAPIQELQDFFKPVFSAGDTFSDPFVVYDDQANRFYVIALEINAASTISWLDIAVSDTSNPLDGFTEMHKINVSEGGSYFADFPKMGWNADAVVVTFDQFAFGGALFDHELVLTMDKSTLLDFNSSTITSYQSDQPAGLQPNILFPARMHDSSPGDPMWFVQSESGFGFLTTVNVVKMTSVLSSTPTFTYTAVPVNPYTDILNGVPQLTAQIDKRILSVDFRNNQLVAAHAVGSLSDSDAHARWYQFDTSGISPVLVQQGEITIGPGVNTYYPAVAINENDEIGFSYMESSVNGEFPSMYVTEHTAAQPLGVMDTPILVRAGLGIINGGRGGDYATVEVDPSDCTFWASNEFGLDNSGAFGNWGTWTAHFSVTSPPTVDLRAVSDSGRSNTDNVTNIATGILDIIAIPGVTVKVYDGATFLGNAAFVSGNSYTYTFLPGQLAQGANSVTVKAVGTPCGTQISDPLVITLDTIAPAVPAAPDLVDYSDTGVSDTDNITSDTTPTFQGTVEANAIVRLYANAVLKGSETLQPNETGYLITSSLLAPGVYTFTDTAEDLAGNVSAVSPGLVVTIVAPTLPAGADPILIVPDFLGSWPTAGHFEDWMLKTPTGLDPANLEMNPLQDSYSNLIDSLTAVGYDPNPGATQSLFFGAYDWRQPIGLVDKKVFGVGDGKPDITGFDILNGDLNSGVEYFAYWINQMFLAGYTHVNVVAFGMGGLLARSWIESGFYSSGLMSASVPILDNLVMVGTPNHGATDAYEAVNHAALLNTDDPWKSVIDLAGLRRQSVTTFAPSVKDLQPQYAVLGSVPTNSFLTNLNSTTSLNKLSEAMNNSGLQVTNLMGTGSTTAQNAVNTKFSTDGDGMVLAKLSDTLKLGGVANVTVSPKSQLIDIGAVGVDHASLATELQPQIFASLGLNEPVSDFLQRKPDDVQGMVDHAVFEAVNLGNQIVPTAGYDVIEDAITQVRDDIVNNGIKNFVSAWVVPDSPTSTTVRLTLPDISTVGITGGVAFSNVADGWQTGNGTARFILIPSPEQGLYQLTVLSSGFFSASVTQADETAARGSGGTTTTTSSSFQTTIVADTTNTRLSSIQPLSFIDADGDWVSVTLTGPGYADVTLRHTVNGGNVIQLIDLHGVFSNSSLNIAVQRRSGDGLTAVGTIQALDISGGPQNFGNISIAGTLDSLDISGRMGALTATALTADGSIDIGAFAVSSTAANALTFNTIGENARLDFNGLDLGSLNLNHGTGHGTLTADAIGLINIIAGSFGLDLTTTGTLGTLNVIGGNISGILTLGSTFGSINAIAAAYKPTGTVLGGGFIGDLTVSGSGGKFVANHVRSASIIIFGTLGDFTVTSDITDSIVVVLGGANSSSIGGPVTGSIVIL